MSHVTYGEIRPLRDKILVKKIDKGMRKTAGGIILPQSDSAGDGNSGIRPRWAQVYAVGSNIDYLKKDQWILMEHGRWSFAVNIQDGDEIVDLRLADPKGILGYQDEKPEGVVSTGKENPGHGTLVDI